jgi:hypothetical protein
MKWGEGPYYCQQKVCAIAGIGVLITFIFFIYIVSRDRSQLVGLNIPLRSIVKPSYSGNFANPNVGLYCECGFQRSPFTKFCFPYLFTKSLKARWKKDVRISFQVFAVRPWKFALSNGWPRFQRLGDEVNRLVWQYPDVKRLQTFNYG